MRAGRIVLLVFVLTAGAYGVTSYALGAANGVSPPPPGFSSLPATPPSGQEAAAITNLLNPSVQAAYGVTASSVAQSRLLASTAAGNLYIVPGSSGACLAFTSGVACGDPIHDRMLALLGDDPTTGNAVGGGVASLDVKSVTLTSSTGSTVTLPVVNGVFTVTPDAAIPSAAMIRFTPNS